MEDVMRRNAVIVGIVLALGGVWVGCGGPRLTLLDQKAPIKTRPSHYGFSLPYPISARPWTGDTAQVSGAERLIPVLLSVNQKGRVTAVTAESAGDSSDVAFYAAYLNTFRFDPGFRDSVRSAMPLRILMQVGRQGPKPILRFPVGANRDISESEIYWAALKTLGVDKAEITTFPSYYYELNQDSVWRRYEYKIFRVDLDSLGDATAIAAVKASTPQFTDQLRSAILWGEYRPMRIDGRAVASTNFLVVSFLPNVAYPTPVWSGASVEMMPLWDRFRVRLLPDTLGEMTPPIPKQEWSGPIEDTVALTAVPELVTSRLAIDSLGAGRVFALSSESWRIRSVLNLRAHNRRFFSALDFSGSPRPWQGLVKLRFVTADSIRVWFDWAPQADPGPLIKVSTGR